jgi:DHA2 family lincomycin resistance protein-like MFS transporter
MLELRAFRYPIFTIGVFIFFITFMIPFAINIILPTYMQSVLGLTAFVAGLIMMPGGVFSMIVAPIAGRLYDRIGSDILVILGFISLLITAYFLLHISVSTSLIELIVLQITMALGLGLIITPTQTNALNSLPQNYLAHGVAIMNTVQQIAAAFGSSLFVGLLGAVQSKKLSNIISPNIFQEQSAFISGIKMSFSAVLVMVLIGLFLAILKKQLGGKRVAVK